MIVGKLPQTTRIREAADWFNGSFRGADDSNTGSTHHLNATEKIATLVRYELKLALNTLAHHIDLA